MKKNLIQYLLDEKGVSHVAIADRLLVSKSAVGDVIRGDCRSQRIEREIASVLLLAVQDVFPNRYDANGELLPRRRKAQIGGYNPHKSLRDIQTQLSKVAA